jgi:hypothetical protein
MTAPGCLNAPTTMRMTPGDRPARPRWRLAVLAWVLWALVPLCLVPITWIDHLLRQAGRPELVILSASRRRVIGVEDYLTVKAISVRVWLPLASMASTSALYSVPRWRNAAGTGRRRARAGRSTLRTRRGSSRVTTTW